MNSREFFYLVAQMRDCQREYFRVRSQQLLRRSRILEKQVDDEISRVKEYLYRQEHGLA